MCLALFVASCASWDLRCDAVDAAAAEVSILYESGGPVGIFQRLSYAERGALVLEATDWRTYCSEIGKGSKAEVQNLLADHNLERAVANFGEDLRYPEECYIPEKLTVRVGGVEESARIDALQGKLLELVRALEGSARDRFGQLYSIDIVERATNRECAPAE